MQPLQNFGENFKLILLKNVTTHVFKLYYTDCRKGVINALPVLINKKKINKLSYLNTKKKKNHEVKLSVRYVKLFASNNLFIFMKNSDVCPCYIVY